MMEQSRSDGIPWLARDGNLFARSSYDMTLTNFLLKSRHLAEKRERTEGEDSLASLSITSYDSIIKSHQ